MRLLIGYHRSKKIEGKLLMRFVSGRKNWKEVVVGFD